MHIYIYVSYKARCREKAHKHAGGLPATQSLQSKAHSLEQIGWALRKDSEIQHTPQALEPIISLYTLWHQSCLGRPRPRRKFRLTGWPIELQTNLFTRDSEGICMMRLYKDTCLCAKVSERGSWPAVLSTSELGTRDK